MTPFVLRCSSDELYAYLKRCRPDLCILEGGGEDEGELDDDEFVLIEDKEGEEKDEEELFQRHCSSGDDWEVSGFILVKTDVVDCLACTVLEIAMISSSDGADGR